MRDRARSWGLPSDAADDLESVVGELAANALEHSGGEFITVTLELTSATVTVGVTDEGPRRGPRRH